MRNTISNKDDIIDSRDVIERIDELESLRDDAKDEAERILEARGNSELESVEQEEIHGEETGLDGKVYYTSADFGEEEYEELKTLQSLAEEASGYSSDWRHGEALIRDDYFETYARQLADDIGAIKKGDSWPYTCIDWEEAASELQQDYSAVEYGDVTYWIRS